MLKRIQLVLHIAFATLMLSSQTFAYVATAAPLAATLGPNEANAITAAQRRYQGYASFVHGFGQWLTVPHNSAYMPGTSGTIEAWVYPIAPEGFNQCRAAVGKAYGNGFWLGLCNGRVRGHAGSPTVYIDGNTVVPDKTWTHIAVTWGGYGITVYVNGHFDGAGECSPDSLQYCVNAPTSTRDLYIGNDTNADVFNGYLSEVRIWNYERGEYGLRGLMHTALDEKLPGLLAVWHLSDDYADVIGGYTATPTGAFVGIIPGNPPIYAATTPVDASFNRLTTKSMAAADAFVPPLNAGVLIGGARDNTASNAITKIDGGSGDATALGTLPEARTYAGAAYADSNDTVYVFGGSTQVDAKNQFDSIYAINPNNGTVRTLAAKLPRAMSGMGAVYQPSTNKIVLMGGFIWNGTIFDYVNDVSVFDVASESIAPAGFTMPYPVTAASVAYSPATDRIYALGGCTRTVVYDSIVEVNVAANSATVLPKRLPSQNCAGNAIADSITNMIYTVNGSGDWRLSAFDPTTGETWLTPISLPFAGGDSFIPGTPQNKTYASVFYSPRNRHALVVGGGNYGSEANAFNSIWRIPLGDGPLTPLNRWDFEGNVFPVLSMDGKGPYFALGRGDTAYKLDGRVLTNTFTAIDTKGQGNIRNIKWLKGTTPWFVFSANDQGIFRNSETYTERLFNPLPCANTVQTINDLETTTDQITPMAGVNGIIGVAGGCKSLYSPDGAYFQPHWGNCQRTYDLAQRASQPDPSVPSWQTNAVWGIVSDGRCEPLPPALNAPQQPAGPESPNAPLYERRYLQAIRQHVSQFPDTEYDMGALCNSTAIEPQRLAFGLNGDMWIAGMGGVCRYPNSALPAFLPSVIASQIQGSNVFNVPIGSNVNAGPSVDADGRIWFGSTGVAGTESGGLSVFEVLNGTSTGAIRATDYNWLNSPLGSLTPRTNAWDSHIDVVSANDEKVWMARAEDIMTLSQRWGVLNGAGGRNILHVWPVRGRIFAATDQLLLVLQPDGITWNILNVAGVNAVQQDERGRVWVAHTGGVNLYNDGGLIDVPSLSLAGPVYALAKDNTNRMWLGSNGGLALYDRGHGVTQLALPIGDGSARVILADRNGDVWAANDGGIARLNNADKTWTSFTDAQGLPANAINDLAQTGDGMVFASTSAGLARMNNAGAFVAVTHPNGAVAMPLATDELGRLWAGNGLLTGSPDNPTWKMRYYTNSGLYQAALNDVATDGADRVYFAQTYGIAMRGSFLPPLAEEVPVITDFNPKHAAWGQEVVIDGSGFGNDPLGIQVQVGGRDVAVNEVTANRIRVFVDSQVQSGALSVRRGKRRTTAQQNFCAIPTITSATPTGGNVGVAVDVTGANFDPDVRISLGATARDPYSRTVSALRAIIEAGDANGNLVVTNSCADTATRADFRKFNLTVEQLTLNQNFPAFQLHAGNATLVSAYLRVDGVPRATDVIGVDKIELRMSLNGNQNVEDVFIPFAGGRPPYFTPGQPINTNTTVGAMNMPNIKFKVSGSGIVRAAMVVNRRTTALKTVPVTVNASAYNAYILLVPIMQVGYSSADLNNFKAEVNANLADFSSRIYPGGLKPLWADEALSANQISSSGLVSVGLGSDFNAAAVQMEILRRRFNSTRGTTIVGTSIGVITTSAINPGPAAGMGSLGEFGGWKDQQECIDDEDDFIDEVGDFLGLGDDDCGPEQPRYMAWVTGDGNVSRYLSHELGHNLGLVPNGAANYANYGAAGGDNHDSASELVAPGTTTPVQCGTLNAVYSFGSTFNQQPNVTLPVVNPISGNELTPSSAGTNASGLNTVPKALLSYACNRTGTNTFFRAEDVNFLLAERYRSLRPVFDAQLRLQQMGPIMPKAKRAVVNQPKLSVVGVVTVTGASTSASIVNVDPLPPQVRPSVDYISPYTLAQFSQAGALLSSQGVLVVMAHSSNHDVMGSAPQHGGHDHADEDGVGFFSASMIRQAGVARITLFKDGVALANYSAGGSAPTVSLNAPSVGADRVTFTWSANDADGDPVSVNLQYSRDGGATWRSVESGGASGSAEVTFAQLGGSNNARARAIAGDGFLTGTATSAAFVVPMQAAGVVIEAPTAGATVLEGRPLALQGYGLDPQDGTLTQTGRLTWISDRDGVVGQGSALAVNLSVGTHVLTLRVTNAASMQSEASVTVNVLGDYDGDGISDEDEAAGGLNALTESDGYADSDGDGVSLLLERAAGTDPANPDSDGDGRNDGAELAVGTDPNQSDALPAPDAVTLWPRTIAVTVDFAQEGNLINQVLQVTSKKSLGYTLSANAPWADLNSGGGNTPGSATLVINPLALNEGANTATLTAQGANNTSTTTVVITVLNKTRFCDANGDGAFTPADKAAVQAQLGKTVQQPGYTFALDLTRDGVIDNADVKAADSCTMAVARTLYLPVVAK